VLPDNAPAGPGRRARQRRWSRRAADERGEM